MRLFVIAHEVSHAFDLNGSLYDEYGNYNNWWTDEERAEYQRLSQTIIDYYNQYEMMGVPVNGELTLSENIRVNAVLSSCDAFYETYDIEETDAMYTAPEERVGIWR